MNELLASFLGVQPNELGSILPGIFGSFSWDLILKGVGLYILIIWVAFVIWVVRDISNRTSSILLQTFAILVIVVFTPIFGLPIYFLIRPKTTLFERYYEELEMAEAEYEESHRCHACGGIVEASYQFCPHCAEKLLEKCVSCKELVQKEWEHCPFCGKNPKKVETPVKEETPKKKGTEKISRKEDVVISPVKEEKEVEVADSLKVEIPPVKKEKTHSIVAEEI